MKKIVVIAIVLIVLLAVPPCSGYTLKVASWDKSGNTVQLYYSDSEAGSLAMSGASKAADQVIKFAQSKKMKIQRSKGSVEGEIRAHAIGWLLNQNRKSANPMDLTMTDNTWYWHLLD